MQQQPAFQRKPPYGVLSVLMIGAFASFLSNTLLNVALPSIMADLAVGPATVQWLSTGFMLVNGIMIPTTAFLIQNYSVRRLFLVAMGLFACGTVLAGNAPLFPLPAAFPVLLLGRMIQASGSAIMMPLLMNVMLVSFPVEKRGAAMGVFGLILMFAPAIGPTLSGWILQHNHWRALFDILAPIALLTWFAGLIVLRDRKARTDERLDKMSLLLSSIGFGGLLYGFSMVGDKGWTSPHVLLVLPAGTAALIAFIMRQIRQERPMLDFRVYRYGMFSLASAITMIMNMAMFSGFLLLPIYMQSVLGFSPLETGLTLLPGALLNAFLSPLNGRLFDKYGGRVLAVAGLAVTALTTFQLSRLALDTGIVLLMALHALRMVGMSMVMMPVSTNGLNQLPPSLYPHGTAMNNTLNQVSGAIGTGILMTVMAVRQAAHAARLARDGAGEGPAEALAMLGGINDTFFASGVLLVLALVLAFFIKRAKPAEA